ncbi:MAG TPA: family 20 glycosylhydrolase [Gammaproteobacteria bacterium]|nr:family 20 glycosylhydrolase [Gammaproteobacteria bacterium]
MHTSLRHLSRALAFAFPLLVAGAAQADDAPLSLIPLPAEVQRQASVFVLNAGDGIDVRAGDRQAFDIANYFAALVAKSRGLKLHVTAAVNGRTRLTKMDSDKQLRVSGAPGADAPIVFLLSKAEAGRFGPEGYRLTVDGGGIRIEAGAPAGLFYGGVTLWQLLMPYGGHGATALVPDVVIEDRPRFRWRGLMLDSARHFQSVAEIEQLIDWMALHKLNVLQWHLTDDQGWRLEIRKYPKLTAIGACRRALGPDAALTGGPGKPYCGFYTQAEAREIVRYAAARYIDVVPEIEIPGHAQAAIAAYPQFGVTGKRPAVSTDWGVHPYLYNVDDKTVRFLEDVLDEIMALFPSTYIDVGGDEALKDQWKASPAVQARMHALGIADEDGLQSWYIKQMEAYLSAHGRKLVGWDEILQGGLPPEATVMSWHGGDAAVQAIQQGHDVVMAYSPTLYLDYLQSSAHDEPPGRPTVVSLKDVYGFDPVPAGVTATGASHVLGAQINLWTEYMPTFTRDQHSLFPRMAALAEIAWSPAASRDWSSFAARLPGQLARYDSLGIRYAKSSYDGSAAAPASPDARNSDELNTCSEKLVLRIEGPRPLEGPRPVYRVDIMDTCWLWKQAPLDGMRHISVTLGDMPWNYQLAHDISSVVVRTAAQGQDALEVHLDTCEGTLLATAALKDRGWLQQKIDAPLPAVTGNHDLCLLVTGDPKRLLWAVDTVSLSP